MKRRDWRLDLDNHARGSSPGLWDDGNGVAEGGIVHLVNEDTEEGGSLFVRIGLELGVDLDDEGGSDGGEQTSLRHKSIHVAEHCGQHTNINVVSRSSSYFFINSLS